MTQLPESAEYPLLRYRLAKNDRERKGWLDYIKHFEPALYDFIKNEKE